LRKGSSLFEIDVELDGLLEEIEGQVESEGQASEELVARFQQFCEAHGEKVDRIGRFVRIMEAREQYCRSEAARLTDRARAAAGKVERTKNMVLYYLLSRDLKKIEGYQFTLRAQKNSQDSVRITDEPQCRSPIAGLMRGLTGFCGKRCSRAARRACEELWSCLFRRPSQTWMQSKRQRCAMSRCQARKSAADGI
jgi:hypothetical protein